MRRDGRFGRAARHAPATSRVSRRARFVAGAAADVELPEKQEAIDDAGVKPGSLTRAVMALEDDSAEAMFECILDWATETKNMELYEAQEEAIMELVEGNSVLLTTPTGSGKTLVATAAIAAATARGDVRTRESVRRLPGARIASEFRVRGCIHPRRDAYPSRLFAIAEPRRCRETRSPRDASRTVILHRV